jgi:hypothetical protein
MWTGTAEPSRHSAATYLVLSIPYCAGTICRAERQDLAWFACEFLSLVEALCLCWPDRQTRKIQAILDLREACKRDFKESFSDLEDSLAVGASSVLRSIAGKNATPDSAADLRREYGFEDSGNGEDDGSRERLGNAAWVLIHTLPYGSHLFGYTIFVDSLVRLYPCEECRTHAKESILVRVALENLRDAVGGGSNGLAVAAFRLHNAVWENIRGSVQHRSGEKDALLTLERRVEDKEELAALLRARWCPSSGI